MRARSRLLAGLLAPVVVVGLTVWIGPAAADRAARAARADHAVASATPSIARTPSVRAPRPGRTDGPPAGRSTGMVLAFAAGLLAVGAMARRARRIADSGDRWRALLLGAPPAVPAR